MDSRLLRCTVCIVEVVRFLPISSAPSLLHCSKSRCSAKRAVLLAGISGLQVEQLAVEHMSRCLVMVLLSDIDFLNQVTVGFVMLFVMFVVVLLLCG